MSLLSPSSMFYPFLQVNPANPLDTYRLHTMLYELESRLGPIDRILDMLPAAAGLLALSGEIKDTEVSHIESCLLRPFYDRHRRAMWYVLNDAMWLVRLLQDDEDADAEDHTEEHV